MVAGVRHPNIQTNRQPNNLTTSQTPQHLNQQSHYPLYTYTPTLSYLLFFFSLPPTVLALLCLSVSRELLTPYPPTCSPVCLPLAHPPVTCSLLACHAPVPSTRLPACLPLPVRASPTRLLFADPAPDLPCPCPCPSPRAPVACHPPTGRSPHPSLHPSPIPIT
jgi:hypothetical protein